MIFYDFIELGPNLSFEEERIAIFHTKVRILRPKDIPSVMVQSLHHSIDEATLELESEIQAKYPSLFEASSTFFFFMFRDEDYF